MYNIQEVFTLKKVLILSSSPRPTSNSDLLCDEFLRGAVAAGHTAQKIRLAGLALNPCLACDYCRSHNCKCVQDDDMKEIVPALMAADVIVLASPVYFHSISAQLKMVLDRTYNSYQNYVNKEFYFLFTSASDSEVMKDGALAGFRSWVRCLPGASEKGFIWGKGLSQQGLTAASPVMQEAYMMGSMI